MDENEIAVSGSYVDESGIDQAVVFLNNTKIWAAGDQKYLPTPLGEGHGRLLDPNTESPTHSVQHRSCPSQGIVADPTQ